MPRGTCAADRPTTITELLYPTHGIRDEMARRGIKPHDHARDNKRFIRDLQAKVQSAKAAAQAPAAATPSRAYQSVKSRVAEELKQRPASAPTRRAPRPAAPKNFMCGKPSKGPVAWKEQPLLTHIESEHKHQGLHQQLRRQMQSADAAAPAPPSPTVPAPYSGRPTAAKPGVPSHQVEPRPRSPAPDFVARNRMEAKLAQRRSSYASPATSPLAKGPSHGRLPAYLIDRKLELAEAAARVAEANKPAECPEGHRVLQDEERLRVLGAVRQSIVNVNAQLDAFPFVVETPGQRRRHDVLTQQLTELEAAEKAFSRKKVVVASSDTAMGVPAPL